MESESESLRDTGSPGQGQAAAGSDVPPPALRLFRRIGRLALTSAVVSLPAILFFAYVIDFSDFAASRVFAVVATFIVTAVSLAPTAQVVAARLGRGATTWTPGEATIVALVGCGASVSVVLNGGGATEGLETVIGIAIAVTGATGVYGITRVASPPSPAGVWSRASAEAVIDRVRTTPDSIGDKGQARRILEARAEIGRQDIAEGFRRYGDANEASGRWFLLVGVVVFAGSVAAAMWLVGRLGERASVAAILTRAAITIPGALVLLYSLAKRLPDVGTLRGVA